MGLDEAGQDLNISFHIDAVNPHRMAQAGLPKWHQVFIIVAVVLQATVIFNHEFT